MLIDIITEKGHYKKYKPTYDEALEFFLKLAKESFIRPGDLQEILKLNLIKWQMSDCYIKMLKEIRLELKKLQ